MRVRLIARMPAHMLGTDRKEFELELPEGATVLDTLRQLADQSPGFLATAKAEMTGPRPHLPLVVTVNGRTAGLERVVNEGDVIVLIPYAIGG